MRINYWKNPNNLKLLLMCGKIINLVVWFSVLAVLAENHKTIEKNRDILLDNQSAIEHLRILTQ